MRKRNELQEKLKSEFEKPENSFDEWAIKNGVFKDIDYNVKLNVVAFELADNVTGRTLNSRNKKQILLLVLPFVITVFLIIAIILINSFSHNLKPKRYGETDAVNIKIDLEEIVDNEDIYIFDLTNVVQIQAVSKDVLKSDESEVLLYTLSDILIPVNNGTETDVFNITYKIKKYKYYEFFGNNYFINLNSQITFNNVQFYYKILYFDNVVSYASFKYNDYEYYLEVKGFDGVTVLDEDNFINLLKNIIL